MSCVIMNASTSETIKYIGMANPDAHRAISAAEREVASWAAQQPQPQNSIGLSRYDSRVRPASSVS